MKRIYEVEFTSTWKRTPKTFLGTPYNDDETVRVLANGDAAKAVAKAKKYAIGRREHDESFDLTCRGFKLKSIVVLAEAEI